MTGQTKFSYGLYMLSLVWSISIYSSDGILEINQVCALTGGCFTGDSGGSPVTITQAGSYRLTSNLTLADENASGIVVSAPNVTIDLNGFSIIGITTCDESPLVCSPTGTGSGIGIQACTLDCENLTVRNGSIIGAGNEGLALGKWGRAADLTVASNGNNGIQARNGVVVQNCSIRSNGGTGIVISTSGPSIFASNITGNIIMANAGYGMNLSGPAVVVGNTITYNEKDGLFGDLAGYGGNVISSNNGTVVSGADEMGVNICDGDTTCP